MAEWQQCWVDAGDDSFWTALTHREQLDDAVEVLGRGDVVGGDVGDPLPVHLVTAHPGVEGQGGQQGSLGGRVIALDVGGRIGLGVSLLLGLGNCLLKIHACGRHLVQDVVGRPIDDPHHLTYLIAHQGLPQRAHDRDGTSHGSLVVEIDTIVLGGRVEFLAVGSQQGLVGGDDGLATAQCREDEFSGRVDTTHEFDDDVDVWSTHQCCGVGGEQS